MVKLKGPGMALEASGSIADQVTFSNWKGKAYLKLKRSPKQPNTGKQVAMRAITAFFSTIWRELTYIETESWCQLPMHQQLSHFHACISYNLARWRDYNTPCTWYPPAGVQAMQTFNVNNVTATARGVRHYIVSATQNQGRSFLIHRGTSTGFTPTWDNLVHMLPIMPFVGSWIWMDYPDPGTYWYKTSKSSSDGQQSGHWQTGPIIVPP